jgi:hypothetical protein
MRHIKHNLVFLFITVLACFNAQAHNSTWQMLGSKAVSKQAERDTIIVKQKGAFSKLQLSVKNNPVTIKRMLVQFKSGQKHEVKLAKFMPKGSKSRVIDLPGKARAINKIIFWYDAKGLNRKQALVTVSAKR